MRNISRSLKTTIASAGVVGLMLLGGALPAFADGTPVVTPTVVATAIATPSPISVTVDGTAATLGTATFTGFGGPTPVVLNGTKQTLQGTFTLGAVTPASSIANIVDATGTNAGWTVSLAMSQLVDATDAVCTTGGCSLSADAVTISSMPTTAPLLSTGTSYVPVTQVLTSSPTSLAGGPIIATAPASSSAGSFLLGPIGVTLTIPANTFSGVYTATAVYTLIAGAVS